MFRTLLKTTAYTLPVFVTCSDVFGYVCRVEGNSMKPLVNSNTTNFIFLSRWGHKNYEFQRGQVVCLASPMDPTQKLLKRIIALEGDTIKTLSYKEEYVTIPMGHCWVEGDNNRHSLDSNIFGPVPLGLIHSKATHVIWPREDFRRIPVCADLARIQKHEDPRPGQSTDVDHGLTSHYFVSSVRSA